MEKLWYGQQVSVMDKSDSLLRSVACYHETQMFFLTFHEMSRTVAKPTIWDMLPAKTQISLGIPPVWSESSLCAQWVAEDPSFMWTAKTDQTGQMPRLIWVFSGRTLIWLVLSCRSSNSVGGMGKTQAIATSIVNWKNFIRSDIGARLICFFVVCIWHKQIFSWHDSF